MISLITSYGVNGYINGEKCDPKGFIDGSSKPNLKHALQTRINGMVKSWIYSIVYNSVSIVISNMSTSYDIWQSLERNFVSTS